MKEAWLAFTAGLKKTGIFLARYLLGPLAAFALIVGALVLVSMGLGKDLQIGGLLGRIFGKGKPETRADVASSVDPDRVRPDGTLILPGEPDSKGIAQAVVVSADPPDLFSDPGTITYTPPGPEAKPVTVTLPDGVTSKDVDKVVILTPEVVAVTVKDTSPVKAETIDRLLEKYGGLGRLDGPGCQVPDPQEAQNTPPLSFGLPR